MKTLLATVVITGLIALYFMDVAFHISFFSMEMLIHNAIHFFVGFIFLGSWVWYKHKMRFKTAFYTISILMVLDYLADYIRDVDNFTLQMLIYDVFIVLWAAVLGYLSMRSLKQKLPQSQDYPNSQPPSN
ncbi:hypothetical protein Q9L42_000905 [Methylomarinum sp. Ch1-1]|uniref:DUF4383 domain-containing protein n=1 Tax=Methylomarinum roseum TaxID=3067653 RepID=A0AAU7NVY8_9GAMM|nr:hypothetical protein [Methylomarinum sp. Ch1-1]MDP4519189.1 hypothetical protein [Methylomarinum sp. Ch1-1]